MEQQTFPESELQAWFEATAQQNAICSSIHNLEELRCKAASLAKVARISNSSSRAGLARALRGCEVLGDAVLVGANESVAPPECSQMRPDIVLVTPAAQYILVELKSKPEVERQAVQELLAYSTAIKMQGHYVNDFIYIIVAHKWDALLTYGVRSMILDGKHVLPLQCRREPTGFSLSVKLELFDFQFSRSYDPWYALSPATLVVMRKIPRPQDLLREYSGLRRYYQRIAQGALDDCRRLHQSGFIMDWKYPADPNTVGDFEMVCLTLFTVNPHWIANEHAPKECHPLTQPKQRGVDGLHLRRYLDTYTAVVARHPTPDEDDPFTQADIHQEAAQAAEIFYPQSTFSEEVISRYRSRAVELDLEKNRAWFGEFDLDDSTHHLRAFLRSLEFWQMPLMMQITGFSTFGDLADFAHSPLAPGHPTNHEELVTYLEAFREYKKSGLGSV